MDSFYLIVLSIAAIVLIVLLTYIGIQLSKPGVTVPVFPPTYNTCPDFWDIQGNVCVIPSSTGKNVGGNVGGIYTSGTFNLNSDNTPGLNSANKTIDFSDPKWGTGKNAICAQQTWSNKYQILFDGISNYNKCPM